MLFFCVFCFCVYLFLSVSLCNFFCRPSGLLHEVILIRAMVPACSWYYFSVLTPYTQMDPFHVRTGFGSICTCRALRTQATFPVEVLHYNK